MEILVMSMKNVHTYFKFNLNRNNKKYPPSIFYVFKRLTRYELTKGKMGFKP